MLVFIKIKAIILSSFIMYDVYSILIRAIKKLKFFQDKFFVFGDFFIIYPKFYCLGFSKII